MKASYLGKAAYLVAGSLVGLVMGYTLPQMYLV